MIKLNRTTEYGLMALKHMSRKRAADPGEVTSAREISDCYGLPFEITAKTLQRLKDTGLIESAQGSRGGYTLRRALDEVTLAEFLSLMEGPQALVACSTVERLDSESVAVASDDAEPKSPSCAYQTKCEIRHLMNELNSRVFKFLSGIRLAELAEGPASKPGLSLTTVTMNPGE